MSRLIRAGAFACLVLTLGSTAGCDSTSSACCKECDKGKPCGDTCINKNETCTKGAGCACQA